MRIVYEDNHNPIAGTYSNTLVIDSADDRQYIYDCDGTWVEIGGGSSSPQTLSISGNSLTISGGNTVTLPILVEQSEVTLGLTLPVNGTITLGATPAGNVTKVYINGVRKIAGYDYTISGATITFLVALINDDIIVDYWV